MKQLIWDLPTRLFHWFLAGSVLGAYGFAQLAPEDSSLFYLHIVFGVSAGILVVWRIIWGFIGSSHARFSSLLFSFAESREYFTSIMRGNGKYYAGHNPGGALAIIGMLALTGAAVFTGLGMGIGGEIFEEPHEVMTNLLMIVVALHVVGVVLAMVMHKENYIAAMLTGRKRGEASQAIPHSNPLGAMVMMLFVITGVAYFANGFDLANGVFQPPGTQISIPFGEGGDHESHGGHGDDDDDDDDDDHGTDEDGDD